MNVRKVLDDALQTYSRDQRSPAGLLEAIVVSLNEIDRRQRELIGLTKQIVTNVKEDHLGFTDRLDKICTLAHESIVGVAMGVESNGKRIKNLEKRNEQRSEPSSN